MTQARRGIFLRSYAKTEAQLAEVAKRALVSVRKAILCGFDRVLVVVPTDYDFGGTVASLTEAFQREGLRAEVCPATGHHSGEALNQALRAVSGDVEFVAIVSNKASEYLSFGVMDSAANLLLSGFDVVGVRISELDVVHAMPIENTMAFWNVQALLDVGGFDSVIGVEEVAPLARLIKKHGKCAVLISPSEETALRIRDSEDGKAHHVEVKDTKRARQEQEAARAGVTLEWINENIAIS